MRLDQVMRFGTAMTFTVMLGCRETNPSEEQLMGTVVSKGDQTQDANGTGAQTGAGARGGANASSSGGRSGGDAPTTGASGGMTGTIGDPIQADGGAGEPTDGGPMEDVPEEFGDAGPDAGVIEEEEEN